MSFGKDLSQVYDYVVGARYCHGEDIRPAVAPHRPGITAGFNVLEIEFALCVGNEGDILSIHGERCLKETKRSGFPSGLRLQAPCEGVDLYSIKGQKGAASERR